MYVQSLISIPFVLSRIGNHNEKKWLMGDNSVIYRVGLQFLPTALPHTAIYQYTKFHFNPFCTSTSQIQMHMLVIHTNARAHHTYKCTCSSQIQMHMFIIDTNARARHRYKCTCSSQIQMHVLIIDTNAHVHHRYKCTCSSYIQMHVLIIHTNALLVLQTSAIPNNVQHNILTIVQL